MVSDNPDQPTVEHFQMLRRQWASKAQLLMATLDALPDANSAAVQGSKELKHATFFSHGRQQELRCFLTGNRLYSCLGCLHSTTFVFENLGETSVLACEMFTSGFLPWLKNVGLFSSLTSLQENTLVNHWAPEKENNPFVVQRK